MQKKIVLLIALILIFLNFSGCTSHKQKDIETLKIACGGDPETLDPRKASGIIEGTVLRQIYEGLFTHDKDGKVVPGTAEKHDVSEDGLIYTFYIREDARWSNGDHVTAHDYAYSWTKTLDPNFAAKYADLLFCIKNGEKYNKGEVSSQELGIEVLGDRTLRVTLEYPASYFLYLTTFFTYYPVHKKTAEEISKWHTNPDTVICNGPFKIVSFKHNDRINLTRNDFYHSSQIVKMKNVQINLSDNNKTILDMFEDNQLDTAEVKIPLSEVARLKQDGRLKTYPFIGTYYYCINTKKPPFDDVRVRKAFALALNREDIVKYITKADEKVALAWVPYGLSDYLEDKDFREEGNSYFNDNDVKTARELLKEAGYKDGQELGEIVLIYSNSDIHKVISQAVQQMWQKNLNVKVNLANQEWKVFLQNRQMGMFNLARSDWIGDYPDPLTFLDTLTSDNGNNYTRWNNGLYDEMISRAKLTVDRKERIKILHEAEEVLLAEMPIIPLFFYSGYYLEQPYVRGVIRDSLGAVYLREAYMEIE